MNILLHICCGVCMMHAVEKLQAKGFAVAGLYYNPNIHPFEEYSKRKDAVYEGAKYLNIKIIEGEYNKDEWFSLCQDHSDDKEGGARCDICFELRLRETLKVCIDKGYGLFTSTLTISPHKNSKKIIDLGAKIGKDKFLAIDFKKEDGFRKTMDKTKEVGIYRQKYCGCIYSKGKV